MRMRSIINLKFIIHLFGCCSTDAYLFTIWTAARAESGQGGRHVTRDLVLRDAETNASTGVAIACPRRIYLDLGVNWANTLRLYETIAPTDANAAWEVYGFEASPLIQPYAFRFCKWLNGELSKEPVLCLPRSGSTAHLSKYARDVGCKHGATLRSCMNDRFDAHLRALKPDPHLNSSTLLAKQANMALLPLGCRARSSRFTFMPAAVSSVNGWMRLESAPHRLIRGGSIRTDFLLGDEGHMLALAEAKRSAWYRENDYVYRVRTFDVASWMAISFSYSDFIVVKMDVEGAEFPVLRKLISLGKMGLVDVLAMECHSGPGRSCARLISETRIAASKYGFKLVDEAKYRGMDRYSHPLKGATLFKWLRSCNLLRFSHYEQS